MQAYSAIPDGVLFLKNTALLRENKGLPAFEVLPGEEGFHPVQVSVNGDCTLLALASTNEVRVYLMELAINSFRKLETLSTHILGSKCRVMSLKWHPYARTNAGLVVLTSTHIVFAQLQVGKRPIIEKKDLKDSSNLRLDPVSITFGAYDTPLGNLTAYLGTRDGDLYRIFPFLPCEAEIPSANVDLIKNFVDLNDCTTLFESWSDEKRCRVVVLLRPSHSSLSPIKLGEPLLIKPYAEELYTEETLDLRAGSVGWATDLIVQTTTNFVNFYTSPSPHSDKLVAITSVKFTKPQKQRQVELITPVHVYIRCDSTMHVLNISQWSSELQNAFESNREASTLRPVTTVTTSDTRFIQPESCTLDLINYNGAMCRSVISKTKRQICATAEIENNAYAAQQGRLESRISALLAELKNTAPQVPLATNWGANLGSLEKLNRVSAVYNQKIAKIAKALAQIKLIRDAQVREMVLQCSDLYKLKDQAANNNESIPRLQAKVDNLIARQSELSSRMRKVANDLLKVKEKQPKRKPSKAEQTWASELRNAIPAKLDALKPQIEDLRSSLAAVKLAQSEANSMRISEDRKLSEIAPKNALELHWRLKRQVDLIDTLKKRLEVRE